MPSGIGTPSGLASTPWKLLLKTRGLVAESWLPYIAPNQSALVSQTVYGTLVPLFAGDVAAKVVLNVMVAGSGAAPTNFFGALYDTSGNRLAVTADSAASAVLTTLGPGALSFTAAYTVPTSGSYYVAVMENGAFGATAMQLNNGGTGLGVAPFAALGANPAPSVRQTGQATMPNPATFIAGTIPFCLGLA